MSGLGNNKYELTPEMIDFYKKSMKFSYIEERIPTIEEINKNINNWLNRNIYYKTNYYLLKYLLNIKIVLPRQYGKFYYIDYIDRYNQIQRNIQFLLKGDF